MEASALVPVEEYLTTDYSPDCDYVDGEVLDRNVGEKDHSKIQKKLLFDLGGLEKRLGIFVIQEQRVQVSPTRFRVPDICVVSGLEPSEQIFTTPPFLCVEILSPEDRMSRMQAKIRDYLEFGVRCIWVIDPQGRRAYIYRGSEMIEPADGLLRTAEPEIAIALADLF